VLLVPHFLVELTLLEMRLNLLLFHPLEHPLIEEFLLLPGTIIGIAIDMGTLEAELGNELATTLTIPKYALNKLLLQLMLNTKLLLQPSIALLIRTLLIGFYLLIGLFRLLALVFHLGALGGLVVGLALLGG
jgi:hypothetical protein